MIPGPVLRRAGVRKPPESQAKDKDSGGLRTPARLGFWVIALLLIQIFAHGCHRGDHDDEPLFVPIEHHADPIKPSQ